MSAGDCATVRLPRPVLRPERPAASRDGATLRAGGIGAGVAEAHRDIGQLVAEALDAGGGTWAVTAPLVETLAGAGWAGASPVVLARALATAQAREAAEAARLLATGDDASARALLDRLRDSRDRLARVLAHQVRA